MIENKLPLLLVDAAPLSQALYELVENAAKYSPRGGRILVMATSADSGMVEIAVENEGPIVPTEMRTQVFEKFFRVPGNSRQEHGFGMGLAIARGIVEAHGGKIWMESTRDKSGTAVRFTVPAKANVHG